MPTAKKKGRPKKTGPSDPVAGSAPKFEHWDRSCADGIFFLTKFEEVYLEKESHDKGKVLFCQESLKNSEVIHPERPSSENVNIFAKLKPGHVSYGEHEKGWEHKNLARNINALTKAYVNFKETGKGMSVYSAFVQSCSHTPSNTVVCCCFVWKSQDCPEPSSPEQILVHRSATKIGPLASISDLEATQTTSQQTLK